MGADWKGYRRKGDVGSQATPRISAAGIVGCAFVPMAFCLEFSAWFKAVGDRESDWLFIVMTIS